MTRRWAVISTTTCGDVMTDKSNDPNEARTRKIKAGAAESGAHTLGVHAATTGRTLAQESAAGTNPNIPPPTIGGRK